MEPECQAFSPRKFAANPESRQVSTGARRLVGEAVSFPSLLVTSSPRKTILNCTKISAVWNEATRRHEKSRDAWPVRKSANEDQRWSRCGLSHKTQPATLSTCLSYFAPSSLLRVKLVQNGRPVGVCHCHYNVRVSWQVRIRNVTGIVARDGVGHTSHHRIGRIHDEVAWA
jgi:hypothetical protein